MNLIKFTELIYDKKYNHTLWKTGFLTFVYAIFLIIFTLSLNYIVFNHPNEQKDFNLFIGTFTISTVLLSSAITTLIQNEKRTKSITNEYHDVFEYLRNLNWYLQSGFGWCRFLAHKSQESHIPGNLTKDDFSSTEAKAITKTFLEMDARIKNMINASSTFPSSLKNQIYLTLDQSGKIFGSVLGMESPHFQEIIINVFIKTNYHVLLDPFLKKYEDDEVRKVMGYCIDWLIFSVRELDIIRQNSEHLKI